MGILDADCFETDGQNQAAQAHSAVTILVLTIQATAPLAPTISTIHGAQRAIRARPTLWRARRYWRRQVDRFDQASKAIGVLATPHLKPSRIQPMSTRPKPNSAASPEVRMSADAVDGDLLGSGSWRYKALVP